MQEFYDKITKLCINHFNGLPKTGKPTTNEWTILSCVVKQDIVDNHLEVVSLGTGTKCIGKSKMSPNGDILNDSHAEIICRRSFLLYLYEHLESDGIFNFDHDTFKYSLKDSIKFHFFTSQVPCGDAAIFPKQDDSEFGVVVPQTGKRPSEGDGNDQTKRIKLNSDIFRTGAKCLPAETKQDLCLGGPDYHTVGAVRTKPGRGDPTLSLSCSDKITKWCHLGIQGALLSMFLKEPIYFSSLIIAAQTSFCKNALRRALFDRFNPLSLKEPYRLHKPTIGQGSTGFECLKTEGKGPCPSSISWRKTSSSFRALEVAVEGKKQGVTMKKRNTKAGRLSISKVELYRAFLNNIKRLSLNVFEGKDLNNIRYSEAKAKAFEYNEAWAMLKSDGFKVWTVKDDSLLQFVVD